MIAFVAKRIRGENHRSLFPNVERWVAILDICEPVVAIPVCHGLNDNSPNDGTTTLLMQLNQDLLFGRRPPLSNRLNEVALMNFKTQKMRFLVIHFDESLIYEVLRFRAQFFVKSSDSTQNRSKDRQQCCEIANFQ